MPYRLPVLLISSSIAKNGVPTGEQIVRIPMMIYPFSKQDIN